MNSGRENLDSLWRAVLSTRPRADADVALWRCRLPCLDAAQLDEAVVLGLLSADERAAARRRAKPEWEALFGARRIVRRMVVAAAHGLLATEVKIEVECVDCGGRGHGRPYVHLPDRHPLRISSSAVGDRLVVALSKRSIGVDIESPARVDFDRTGRVTAVFAGWQQVADVCASTASRAEIWTALEALSKTTGRGLIASVAELRSAIETHDLSWIVDPSGFVTCVASEAPRRTLAVIDLSLNADESS